MIALKLKKGNESIGFCTYSIRLRTSYIAMKLPVLVIKLVHFIFVEEQDLVLCHTLWNRNTIAAGTAE